MQKKFIFSIKLGLLLCAVGIISGLALSVTFSITKDNIEKQKKAETLESLPEVLPSAISFSDQITTSETKYFEGKNEKGEITGYVIYGEQKGYQSIIKFLVGIDPQGNIQGLRILEQGETPGLGARITEVSNDKTVTEYLKSVFKKEEPAKQKKIEPWFPKMFKGKFYKDLYVSKTEKNDKAIQAITGATITSQAVVDGVKNSIENFLNKVKRD